MRRSTIQSDVHHRPGANTGCTTLGTMPRQPFTVAAMVKKIFLRDTRADGRGAELTAADDANAVLAHEPAHPALADPQAQFVQFLGHTMPAIAAQAQPMLIADMGQNPCGDLHGRCQWESIVSALWRPLGLWSFWRLRQPSGIGLTRRRA